MITDARIHELALKMAYRFQSDAEERIEELEYEAEELYEDHPRVAEIELEIKAIEQEILYYDVQYYTAVMEAERDFGYGSEAEFR